MRKVSVFTDSLFYRKTYDVRKRQKTIEMLNRFSSCQFMEASQSGVLGHHAV